VPSKWKHFSFALLLLAFAAAASCSAPPSPQFRTFDDEDDRPPIIVKNGTIDFLAVSVKNGPGFWDPAASTAGPWTLKHDTNVNEGKHFNVAVLFGTTGPCKDKDGNPAGFEFKNIVKLIFTNTANEVATMEMVKNNGDPRTAQVSVSPAGTLGKVTGPLLAVGNPTASLMTLRMDENANKYFTCAFKPDLAIVTVFQKKQ